MDDQPPKSIRILSINLKCCDDCPRRLKKRLLKMNGMDSISIGAERDIVFVTGTIVPMTLLQNVETLGKKVEVLYPKMKHQNFDEKHTETDGTDDEEDHKHHNFEETHRDTHAKGHHHQDVRYKDTPKESPYRCPYRQDSTADIPNETKYRIFSSKDGRRVNVKKKEEEFYKKQKEKGQKYYEDCVPMASYANMNNKEEEINQKQKEEEHKYEDYSPMTYDERVCRDFWCTSHPPMRKIVDRVPAEKANHLFGGVPFFGFGGADPYGGRYHYPNWYNESASRPYQQSRMLPGARRLPGPFNFP